MRPKTKADEKLLWELEGKKTIYPLDDFLKLSNLPFKMTIELMLRIAHVGQQATSYEEAQQIIEKTSSLKINDDTIRLVTNFIGKIVFENDTKKANQVMALLDKGKLEFPDKKKKGVLYIESDGVMLNTRQKEDGSSWHENKIGIIFSEENIIPKNKSKGVAPENRLPRRTIIKKGIATYLGSVQEFKKYFFATAIEMGYGKYEISIFLSDGAAWLRNLRKELFLDSIFILDFFHLAENVYKYAKAYFGVEPEKHKEWAKRICELLKESKSDEVLAELKTHSLRSETDFNLANYIIDNSDGIDYKHYISCGYHIGSGPIESSNKSVMQQRMNQPGMRWAEVIARYVLALRAKHKSDSWLTHVVLPVYEYFGEKYFSSNLP